MFQFFSPLEQFEVKPILYCFKFLEFFGVAVSNFSVFMLLGLVIVILVMSLMVFRPKLIASTSHALLEEVYDFILNLVTSNLGGKGQKYFPLVFTLFIFILFFNIFGLLPLGFTVTAQIVVSVFLSMTAFLGITILALKNHKLNFLALFFPSEAPLYLCFLLVPIELISYFSRPFSFAIRLFANMVAGHVLLKILSGFLFTLLLVSFSGVVGTSVVEFLGNHNRIGEFSLIIGGVDYISYNSVFNLKVIAAMTAHTGLMELAQPFGFTSTNPVAVDYFLKLYPYFQDNHKPISPFFEEVRYSAYLAKNPAAAQGYALIKKLFSEHVYAIIDFPIYIPHIEPRFWADFNFFLLSKPTKVAYFATGLHPSDHLAMHMEIFFSDFHKFMTLFSRFSDMRSIDFGTFMGVVASLDRQPGDRETFVDIQGMLIALANELDYIKSLRLSSIGRERELLDLMSISAEVWFKGLSGIHQSVLSGYLASVLQVKSPLAGVKDFIQIVSSPGTLMTISLQDAVVTTGGFDGFSPMVVGGLGFQFEFSNFIAALGVVSNGLGILATVALNVAVLGLFLCLELFVAVVQAYVFTILFVLYLQDAIHLH